MTMYSARLRGLAIDGTPDSDGDVFVLDHIEGLESPDVDLQLGERNDGGSYLNSVRFKERQLLVVGTAYSIGNVTFDVLRIRRKIEVAAQLVTTQAWLYVDEPSPGIPVQMIVSRAGKLSLPKPRHNVQTFEIPLVAVDPRKYKQGTVSSAVVNGSPQTLVNEGNYPTYCVAVLNSTATNPWIQNDAFGRITFQGSNLPANSYIDFQNKRTVHGVNGVTDAAARPRFWWPLVDGNNTIRSSGSWTVTWRSCWI